MTGKGTTQRVMCTVDILKVGNEVYHKGDIFEVKSLEGLAYVVTRLVS